MLCIQVPGHAHVRHLGPPENRYEGCRPAACPGLASRKGNGGDGGDSNDVDGGGDRSDGDV